MEQKKEVNNNINLLKRLDNLYNREAEIQNKIVVMLADLELIQDEKRVLEDTIVAYNKRINFWSFLKGEKENEPGRCIKSVKEK